MTTMEWKGCAPTGAEEPWLAPSFRQRLVAFARRFVGDDGDAEDVAQEALFRARRGAATLRSADRAEAWLFRICRHTAIDHVRARRVRRGVWAPMPADGEAWVAAARPRKGRSPRPAPVPLRDLPAHQRLLMELHYRRHVSQPVLCRMTGLSPSALRVRLFRARRALQQRWQAQRPGPEGARHP